MAGRSARQLVIELVADVTDFAKGTQQADTALGGFVSDAEGDLDRLERASKDATGDMERHFDNLAREARRSMGRIGDDSAHDLSGAKDSFGEAGSEVGAEFASNLGESLASGDLSAMAADTAGGLVSAFAGIAGPIGVGLAGVAAVATGIFAKMQAEAQRRAETIAAITGSIFDQLSGDMNAALEQMIRGSAYQDFVAGFSASGDVNEGLREMRKLAGQAGVSVSDIADAFINGGPAAERLRVKLDNIQNRSGAAVTNVRGVAAAMSPAASSAAKLDQHMSDAAQATADAEASTRALWDSMIGATAQARLFESAASRASSSMAAAARAAAAVSGAPGTVVGGKTLRL